MVGTMPGFFVTATGTDVGKTYVTAGLIRAGRRAGLTMDALKPVLSGFAPDTLASSDAAVLLGALDRLVTDATVAAIAPWRFVAPRRGLVIGLAVLLAAGGLLNLRYLSIDAVPDISPKQVMILTQAKGLGPLEAERLVTFPIENAMAGVPGMTSIRSTSRFGLSAVYVTFRDDVDVDTARERVAERLRIVEATMLPGVGTPQMGPVATGLGEIYQFRVVGPGYTPMQLRRILQWQIAPRLKLVPGVTDVNIYGGQPRNLRGPDPTRRPAPLRG